MSVRRLSDLKYFVLCLNTYQLIACFSFLHFLQPPRRRFIVLLLPLQSLPAVYRLLGRSIFKILPLHALERSLHIRIHIVGAYEKSVGGPAAAFACKRFDRQEAAHGYLPLDS